MSRTEDQDGIVSEFASQGYPGGVTVPSQSPYPTARLMIFWIPEKSVGKIVHQKATQSHKTLSALGSKSKVSKINMEQEFAVVCDASTKITIGSRHYPMHRTFTLQRPLANQQKSPHDAHRNAIASRRESETN